MTLATLDWFVLIGTVLAIVVYGAWRSRGVRDVDGFVRGDTQLRWPTIGLGIMATQASAITFLSTPGQGFADGLRFIQFYLGLPLAMIVISCVFVPVYYRLGVRTAYEYLEHRFDVRVRYLGGALFLLGRGLATGITIYAPSIILSQLLGWPLQPTIWAMGGVVVVYTVLGGSRAVAITQQQQMIVMLAGLAVAAIVVVVRLPDGVSLGGAVRLAGALGRINALSFDVDLASRYNFWSGLAGGFFLALAYFGTDQSQVQRYLSGRSIAESRLGLLFNGIFKLPMQFVILFIGVMVFVFYLFNRPPLHFDQATLAEVTARRGPEIAKLAERHDQAFADRRVAALGLVQARGAQAEATARTALRVAAARFDDVHRQTQAVIHDALPAAETRDTDYVFLSFVVDRLPIGLVGLLIAVILCAAMSAIASGLISLGATTTVDFYLRIRHGLGRPPASRRHDLRASQAATIAWAAIAIGFASLAQLFANLIEAVNILGSIFYGTILGLFVVALFLRRVTATPVLIGALTAQSLIVLLFATTELGFLWFNAIGCAAVVAVSLVAQAFIAFRISRRNLSMKVLTITAVLAVSATARAQSLKLPDTSPAASVSQTLGFTEITVRYHRPAVAGRAIWGHLVPYGEPWRTGANENTTIEFSTDALVGGVPIKAGTYGLHTLPTAKDWTVMLSTVSTSWGSYSYDPKEDAARITVTPRTTATAEERLAFRFDAPTSTQATLVLAWDKLALPIPIEVDTPKVVMASVRLQLRSTAGFSWRGYAEAAAYWVDHGGPLDEALGYADRSIAMEPHYRNATVRAAILDKQGNAKAAAEQRAQAQPLANEGDLLNDAYRLLGDHKTAEAIAMFRQVADRYPASIDAQTSLADALAAKGDKPGAIAAYTRALALVKDPGAKRRVEQALARLKSS